MNAKLNDADVTAVVGGYIKNHNLSNLVEEESKLNRQIGMLNSEFHTLLYENYNKLISAAQIIGKMSDNFDHMEEEIDKLSSNMEHIIQKSDYISVNLSNKFRQLSKLSNEHSKLERLQYASDLNNLVVSNGQSLSKILMDSFEDEDWLTEHKPRHVRPVVIKIIEDLNGISEKLARYCEEGPHIELSGQHSLYHSPPMNNNIKKLFSERIEIFGPVKFSRRTILFGIVKIVLRTMVECVRLKTFNRNGVHQLQIDAKYLQHELSRFVSDENVIFAILEESVTSAEIRSI